MANRSRILSADTAAIETAAQRIAAGEIVAVPTETVYGLAADARNGEAVARIYAAKRRPAFNPLIVHVAGLTEAQKLADFDKDSLLLVERFWPGPLTLVLPRKADADIATLTTAGLDTIALRAPAHPVMRALLARGPGPLAAPSANASGRISPTRAEHVADSLGDSVPLILDGGPCEAGLESTIVRVGDNAIDILRPGPVTREMLAQATGLPINLAYESSDPSIVAPGQLAGHYAPAKPLRLDIAVPDDDEFHIGFGDIRGDFNLSETGDPVAAAARLFDALHAGDASDRPRIAAAPIPDTGIGRAINDRLKRAAAEISD